MYVIYLASEMEGATMGKHLVVGWFALLLKTVGQILLTIILGLFLLIGWSLAIIELEIVSPIPTVHGVCIDGLVYIKLPSGYYEIIQDSTTGDTIPCPANKKEVELPKNRKPPRIH